LVFDTDIEVIKGLFQSCDSQQKLLEVKKEEIVFFRGFKPKSPYLGMKVPKH